jgi:hypothetical protein
MERVLLECPWMRTHCAPLRRPRAALAAVVIWALRCGGGGGGDQPEAKGCNAPITIDDAAGAGCPVASGPAHGLDANGRVDVTAAEAWPNRPAEPPALTSTEAAGACAVLLACRPELIAPKDGGAPDLADGVGLCLDRPNMWEERAVPSPDIAERWAFEARAIVAVNGDCAAVRAIETKRPSPIACEEDGCYRSLPDPVALTCSGDVATFSGGQTRDCSHAFARCDASSKTGCTDRPLTACDPKAADRCDGDVKLGCDHCGLVSFHDCARQGGHCVEEPGVASCVYPDAGTCTSADQRCDGSVLSVCMGGQIVQVDCVALGLAGCADRHCPAK